MSISDKGIVWGYGIQSVAFATSVAASGGLRARREGGLADFKSGMVPIEAPIHRGHWGEHEADRKPGYYMPSFQLPGLLRPGLIKLLLDQVMTPTAAGSGFTYALLSGVSQNPSATKSLTLWRRNTFAASKDKKLTGCYVKSIKLSGSQSQQKVHCDVDFVAYDFDDEVDGSGGTYTIPTESWLTHAGVVMTVGGSAVRCPEWDLLIDFGTVAILDNANNPQEFMLGPLKVEGSIKTPYDADVMADFEGQTANTLTWAWGTAGSSGYLLFVVPVQYDEPDEDAGEERIRTGINFKLARSVAVPFSVALQV